MVAIFLLFSTYLAASLPISVDPDTNMFIDSLGRERFFHGLNVIQKGEPWYAPYEGYNVNTTFSDVDMARWRTWGFNAVRLNCMWPGFEPERGQINMTYLHTLEHIVNMAQEHGIYVLLDFHQDSFSEKTCGEGFPLWAAHTDDGFAGVPSPYGRPYKTDDNGLPGQSECSEHPWALYMTSFSGSRCYQDLYDNIDGIQDSLAYFWGNVSSVFVGNDNVLGYELMNEPFAGNFWENLGEIINGYTDKHYLQPMYENIQKQIRVRDDDHIIFFEPMLFDMYFSWLVKRSGFTDIPGGSDYSNRTALSWHYYLPTWTNFILGSPAEHFENRRKDTERLRIGGMLTEFSIASFPWSQPSGADEGIRPNLEEMEKKLKSKASFYSIEEMLTNIETADQYLFSWLGWEYKILYPITGASYSIYRPDGSIDQPRLSTLTRTYPQAVAGRTTGFYFNNATAEFWLNFTSNDVTNAADTVVFLHEEFHYSSGYEVDFVSGQDFFNVFSSETNYLTIKSTRNVPLNETVSIHITRK